jgi:dihydroorotate dehydrogenase (NAD+) catalytic subunit
VHNSSKPIKFGSLSFPRNGVLASGILGVTGWSMVSAARAGAGGITCKSISYEKRKGHPTPVIQGYAHGLINAVGLSSTGLEQSNGELAIVRNESDAVVIASIFGDTPADLFAKTAAGLDSEVIDAIEINISCPNVEDEFGYPFSYTTDGATSVTTRVREVTDLPHNRKSFTQCPEYRGHSKSV